MAVLGTPIVIDGSHGEGGGALLRTALAMSALTQQPLRVVNIRGGTKFAGLNPEDVTILRALALACSAETLGAEVGEASVSFLPTRRPRGLNETLEIVQGRDGTGFANALVVLNSLLPVMARTGVYTKLTAEGETFGNNMLSFDYFANVTLQAYRKLGIYSFAEMSLAGFGRGSRGEVRLETEPSAINGILWPDRGEMLGVRAIVTTAELSESVGQRGVAHLTKLAYHSGLSLEPEPVAVRAKGPGCFITVWAEFERGFGGATAMGARGVRVEAVAQQAFEAFAQWLRTDATVDAFLADQVLLAAALAEGESTFKTPRLTQRFLTSSWVIKQFLPIHITIRGQENEPGVVSIKR
ncbi:MAG TPA: RNA 3'-terminal phosphate cyclase [Fimbriimonadaceae bacterium]|nr:RNA 3'-terminal phosphate cyclase [Fimbriimonadaceae bacterium]